MIVHNYNVGYLLLDLRFTIDLMLDQFSICGSARK